MSDLDSLRPSVLVQLRKQLHQPPSVRSDDFYIDVKPDEAITGVSITYLGDQSLYFTASIMKFKEKMPGSGVHNTRIDCRFAPGEIAAEEAAVVWGLSGLTTAVRNWAKRIDHDLQNTVSYRALREHQARIDELESVLKDMPDTYATREQVHHLNNWIDQFASEMRAAIEALEISNQDKETRIEAMEAELASLRDRITTVPVKNWVRMALPRIYSFTSSEALGRLADNAKKVIGLLGSGDKSD